MRSQYLNFAMVVGSFSVRRLGEQSVPQFSFSTREGPSFVGSGTGEIGASRSILQRTAKRGEKGQKKDSPHPHPPTKVGSHEQPQIIEIMNQRIILPSLPGGIEPALTASQDRGNFRAT